MLLTLLVFGCSQITRVACLSSTRTRLRKLGRHLFLRRKEMADNELPKREEITGNTPVDRMMQMVLSLRAELYDLYTKHQALLDENNRLRATQVLSIKLKETSPENKDAVPTDATRDDRSVLGREREDRAETLTLPTTEDACREADASPVSGDGNAGGDGVKPSPNPESDQP